MTLFTFEDFYELEDKARTMFGSDYMQSDLLENEEFVPSDGVCKSISDYSKALSVRHSENLDEIRIVLN